MPIGSIVGGLIGSAGASGAGNAAYGAASDLANKDVARFSPYLSTGLNAEDQLSQLYGLGALSPMGPDGGYGTLHGNGTPEAAAEQTAALGRFRTSPGYQFRLQEGTNALDRSGAARGMLLSGAQEKGISDYGQNTGSAEFGNYIGQLNTLAGGGLSAAGGASSAANQAMLPGIQDRFNGSMSGANALANGISGGINSLVSLGAYGGAGGSFGIPGWNGGSAGGGGGYGGNSNPLAGI